MSATPATFYLFFIYLAMAVIGSFFSGFDTVIIPVPTLAALINVPTWIPLDGGWDLTLSGLFLVCAFVALDKEIEFAIANSLNDIVDVNNSRSGLVLVLAFVIAVVGIKGFADETFLALIGVAMIDYRKSPRTSRKQSLRDFDGSFSGR